MTALASAHAGLSRALNAFALATSAADYPAVLAACDEALSHLCPRGDEASIRFRSRTFVDRLLPRAGYARRVLASTYILASREVIASLLRTQPDRADLEAAITSLDVAIMFVEAQARHRVELDHCVSCGGARLSPAGDDVACLDCGWRGRAPCEPAESDPEPAFASARS